MKNNIIKCIIAIVIILILLIYIIGSKNQVKYSLLDTITLEDETMSIEGFTVGAGAFDTYKEQYSLDKYNVDFTRKRVLITSYDVTKIEKYNSCFIKIFVTDKHMGKANVYLLNKPNLYFDERDAPDYYIINENKDNINN